MNFLRYPLPLLIAVFFLCGCSPAKSTFSLRNASDEKIDAVVVSVDGGKALKFGALTPGSTITGEFVTPGDSHYVISYVSPSLGRIVETIGYVTHDMKIHYDMEIDADGVCLTRGQCGESEGTSYIKPETPKGIRGTRVSR